MQNSAFVTVYWVMSWPVGSSSTPSWVLVHFIAQFCVCLAPNSAPILWRSRRRILQVTMSGSVVVLLSASSVCWVHVCRDLYGYILVGHLTDLRYQTQWRPRTHTLHSFNKGGLWSFQRLHQLPTCTWSKKKNGQKKLHFFFDFLKRAEEKVHGVTSLNHSISQLTRENKVMKETILDLPACSREPIFFSPGSPSGRRRTLRQSKHRKLLKDTFQSIGFHRHERERKKM